MLEKLGFKWKLVDRWTEEDVLLKSNTAGENGIK